MKVKKHIVSALLAAALLFCMSVPALAEGTDVTFSLPTQAPTVQCGQTVDVPITVSENSGFSGVVLELSFDNTVLEPISDVIKNCYTVGEVGVEFNISNGIKVVDGNTTTLRFGFAKIGNVSMNGLLVTAHLKAADNALSGSTDLSLTIYNEQINHDVAGAVRPATCTLNGGSVSVYGVGISCGGKTYTDQLPTGTFDLTANSKEGAKMLLACYNADNKMVAIKSGTSTGSTYTFTGIDNSDGGIKKIKVFAVDSSFDILLRAFTIESNA